MKHFDSRLQRRNGAPEGGSILRVTHHAHHECTWLDVRGELDIGSAPRLAAGLEVARLDTRPIVVDMRGLRFIDSTGLRTLLYANEAGARTGARLSLIAGPWTVQRIFDLTGTVDRFVWIDAPAGALSAPGKSTALA